MNYQECWITGTLLCIKARCVQECCHGKETNWVTAKFLSLIFALLLLYAAKLWDRIPDSLFNLQEQTRSAKNHNGQRKWEFSSHLSNCHFFQSWGWIWSSTVKTAASFWHCTCRLTSWSPIIINFLKFWSTSPCSKQSVQIQSVLYLFNCEKFRNVFCRNIL